MPNLNLNLSPSIGCNLNPGLLNPGLWQVDETTLYSALCTLVPCFVFLLVKQKVAAVFRGRQALVHAALAGVFAVYCWQVYDVTGAGDLGNLLRTFQNGIAEPLYRGTYNLVPFHRVAEGFWLNVLMCVPLGFMLPLIWKSYRRLWVSALAGASFSLLIELSQLVTVRATDVDDLIANTVGTVVGYVAWRAFSRLFGVRARTTASGLKEAAAFVVVSFAGRFFLYDPTWFNRYVAPLLFG